MNAEHKQAISRLQKRIKSMRSALNRSKNTVARCNYIVICSNVALSPEIVDGKTTGNFKFALPETATRFEYDDAEMIANDTSNGNAEVAEVVAWQDFTQFRINQSIDLLTSMGAYEEV